MAVKGIFGSALGTAEANTNSYANGRMNIQSDSTNPLSEDATKVKISDGNSPRTNGIESAIRYLSPLQTIVDTASAATSRASEVLYKTLDIAKQVAAEVDPVKRSALSSEGAALLGELATITQSKTPNGVSVIGQGSISYSFSLDKENESQGNSITVNISDIQLSQSALGLSSVTSSSLRNSNAQSQTSLEEAISSVANMAAGLDSVSSQISDTASLTGASRAAKGLVVDTDADELSQKIASAIRNSPELVDTNNLDITKVFDLLKTTDDSESDSESESDSSTSSEKSTDKTNEDNGILLPLGVSETAQGES